MTGEREQADPNFLKELGKQMVSEVIEDDYTLVSVYGTNLLICMKQAGAEEPVEFDDDAYEYTRQQFEDFHTTEFPPNNPLARENLSSTEVFDGYMEELLARGFIKKEMHSKTGAEYYILTAQGLMEANLFEAQNNIEIAEDSGDFKELNDARYVYRDAAEARLEFWKRKVAEERLVLSDDEKERIVAPTMEYGYKGLFPQSFYEQKAAEAIQDLTSPKA